MWKCIPIGCFLLLLTAQLPAQDTIAPRTFLGVRGGVTFNQISTAESIGQDLLQGITSGFTFQHFARKGPGIQLEINYVQRGWAEPDSLYERQLTYLELPFMTHIGIGKGKFKFFLNLGPYVAYLLDESEVIPSDVSRTYYGRPLDQQFEYGLCGGAGFNLETDIGKFQLEARYNNGLQNIFDEDVLTSSLNQSIQGTLSYSIRLFQPKIEPKPVPDAEN